VLKIMLLKPWEVIKRMFNLLKQCDRGRGVRYLFAQDAKHNMGVMHSRLVLGLNLTRFHSSYG
jgi:hypothetical protein